VYHSAHTLPGKTNCNTAHRGASGEAVYAILPQSVEPTAAAARLKDTGLHSAGSFGGVAMMRRSILASMTGVALVTLIAAGCSGESSKSGKVAAVINACALLATEEVGTVFARTFDAAKPGQSAGGGENQGALTSCIWESPGAEVAGDIGASVRNTVFVNVMVWSWPAGSGGSEKYMDSFVEAAKTYDLPEPVPVMLGDAAHWNGETMNVKKADVTMTISLSGPVDAAALKTAAESLANSALSRL
jgi:hypothetical protein